MRCWRSKPIPSREVTLATIVLAFFSVAPAANGWSSRASKTFHELREVALVIALFQSEHGRLPHSESWFAELSEENPWSAHLRSNGPLDRWGNQYVYRPHTDGKQFELYSIGENGRDDGGRADDIAHDRDITEGYYWKRRWPQGKKMAWGAALGFVITGLLWSLGPQRLRGVSGIACLAATAGMVGSAEWLKHPGRVSARNDPLLAVQVLASLIFLWLLFLFTRQFLIVRKTNEHTPAKTEQDGH